MPSRFFRILFNSSILVPWLLLNFATSISNKKYTTAFILFTFSLLVIGSQKLILSWQKKHVRSLWVTIDSCDGTQDKWLIPFLISSFTPLVEVGFNNNLNKFVILKWIGLVILLSFILLKTNHNFENILLRIKGYKVYSVTASGIKYTLFSKRNIRKANDRIYVKRIFEFVLIEEDR